MLRAHIGGHWNLFPGDECFRVVFWDGERGVLIDVFGCNLELFQSDIDPCFSPASISRKLEALNLIVVLNLNKADCLVDRSEMPQMRLNQRRR